MEPVLFVMLSMGSVVPGLPLPVLVVSGLPEAVVFDPLLVELFELELVPLPPPPAVVSPPFPLSQAKKATMAKPPRRRLRVRKECT
jgi:hypothetical protein